MTEDGLRYAVLAHSVSTDDVALIGPYGTQPVADRAAELVRRAVVGRVRSAADVTVTVRPMRDGRDLTWLCGEWAIELGPVDDYGPEVYRGGEDDAGRPPRTALPPRANGTGPPAH